MLFLLVLPYSLDAPFWQQVKSQGTHFGQLQTYVLWTLKLLPFLGNLLHPFGGQIEASRYPVSWGLSGAFRVEHFVLTPTYSLQGRSVREQTLRSPQVITTPSSCLLEGWAPYFRGLTSHPWTKFPPWWSLWQDLDLYICIILIKFLYNIFRSCFPLPQLSPEPLHLPTTWLHVPDFSNK